MATENKSNALAQIGPVAAPLAGVVFAVVFIATALLSSSVADGSDELNKAAAAVRANMSNPAVVVTPDTKLIPLPDSVATTFARSGTNGWKTEDGNKKLLELPVKWEVILDAPEGDPFAKADENQDGFIDEIEWGRSDLPTTLSGTQAVFKNWDRNPTDGQISRVEWGDPPRSDAEAFAELNTNGGDELTAPDEITSQQVTDWDSYPFNGAVDVQEFVDRYKPKQERALGPVRDVTAKIDSATMEIVVSWQDPDVNPKPEDISFIILRRAPETVAKRQRDYARKVNAYNDKLRERENAFNVWLNDPAKGTDGKTNKERHPTKTKAEKAAADKAYMDHWQPLFDAWWNDPTKGADGKTRKELIPEVADAETAYIKLKAKPLPKPVAPEQVSDWERVTDQPVTANEYRDKSFDLDVTYTYAVYMGTQKKPMRQQRVRSDTEKDYPGWFFYADDQVAAGHPVLVRNRIEMAYDGVSGDAGIMLLTQWFKDEATSNWYRVRISETANPGDPVGGDYRMGQLRDRKVALLDIAGAPVAGEGVLTSDTTINFSTGLKFVLGNSKGFILNSAALGDVLLPKETRQPWKVTQTTASTANALEVRCLGVKGKGDEATFELTRWHKVGDNWLRVVMVSAAKSAGEVGGEVLLDKPGADVTVYDATGKKLAGADLTSFKDIKVDLKAGKFEGLAERTVTVGGKAFDLFGTLYTG